MNDPHETIYPIAESRPDRRYAFKAYKIALASLAIALVFGSINAAFGFGGEYIGVHCNRNQAERVCFSKFYTAAMRIPMSDCFDAHYYDSWLGLVHCDEDSRREVWYSRSGQMLGFIDWNASYSITNVSLQKLDAASRQSDPVSYLVAHGCSGIP